MDSIYLHGEVCLKRTKGAIPDGAKKVEPKDGSYKIANSETTGNHHLLEAVEGIDVFEKDGVFYVRPSEPMTVRCVLESRHDSFTVEPVKENEVIEIYPQNEVDHLTDAVRAVQD